MRSTLQINDKEVQEQFPTSFDNLQDDFSYRYACYLFHSLTKIVTNGYLDVPGETKEELISVNNFNLLVKIIQEAVNYGLSPYLPEYFVTKMKVTYPKPSKKEVIVNEEVRLRRLSESTKALKVIFLSRRVLGHAGLEFGLLELLFCHFWLKTHGIEITAEHETLEEVYQNRVLLFQHLMLLKGLSGVSKEISILLHQSLLDQLKSKGGFEIFSRLLMSKSSNSPEAGGDWHTYEIISKIVAAKGHTKEFYQEMLLQILDFLRSCLGMKDLAKFIPVCTTSLQKLCGVSREMTQMVQEMLMSWLEILVNPVEILTGTVVMTGPQFYEALTMVNVCFGGTSSVSLPSRILVPYYRVLFKLYCLSEDEQKSLLASILMHLFNNRESIELKSMIKGILFAEDNAEKTPFDRLLLKKGPADTDSFPSIVICAQDETPYVDVGHSFSQFLTLTGNMLLVNDVFIILLEVLGHEMSSSDQKVTKGDLLFEEDDQIGELLSSKFMKRLVLIEVLQNLINCKQFQAHINGDPRKILDFVKDMLPNEFHLVPNTDKKKSRQETTMLLLTIFKELLYCVRNKDIEVEMLKFVKEIQKANTDPEISRHLSALFADPGLNKSKVLSESNYDSAMSLLNQPEVYLKVYGIQQLIQLLNQKDSEAIANKHVLLVLALKNLKIEESYAYLNTIRLIIALTNVMEAEVIDALIAEFENRELDVDFRMKIGETTVKIAEALGPITFKYRKELVNCFLRGCLNEKPELRTSSLSNVGSICKILTYQVASFFQEVIFDPF